MSCIIAHLFLVFGLVISVMSSPHNLTLDRAAGDCSCSGFVNSKGYGQCKKSGLKFPESKFCYVNLPSTCAILVESETDLGRYASAEPCLGKSAPYGNSDATLSDNVHLKYFNKNNRYLGKKWDKGGQTISFSGSKLTIQEEKNFLPDIKTTFITHGFMSTSGNKELCEDWVNNYGDDVQVICIDWKNLALQWHLIRCGGAYNCEAKNAVDVGVWLGHLLDRLVEKTGLNVDKIHLIGHSLGAHVVGNMGRTFKSLTGKQVARVTGLDPAGPLFVQDNYGLHKYEIGRDSGVFVDIIHSNGDLNPHATSAHLGDLHALGHVDFYPNGGRNQGDSGCHISMGTCSHGRSYIYYLDSIHEYDMYIFTSFPCTSPETCSKGQKTSGSGNRMGEHAIKPEGDDQKLYYLRVTKNYN